MAEQLKISDYIILCSEFEKDPEDTSKLNAIDDFISKLEVREYLPLRQKEMVAMEIITSISQDFDAPATAAFLENGRVTKGLLSYCLNLENDLSILSYNYFVVDAIYEYGLYNAIVSHCENDYKRLIKVIDDMINVSNIYKITQTASLFSEDSYDEWIKNMNELKDSLDSEELKALLEIAKDDSEEGQDIISRIREIAMEQANKETKREADKFSNAAEFLEKQTPGEEEENNDENNEDNSNIN